FLPSSTELSRATLCVERTRWRRRLKRCMRQISHELSPIKVLLERKCLVFHDPSEKISQPVSHQNHPPISNPICNNSVSHRKRRGSRYCRAVFAPTPRRSDSATVPIRKLRRNLVALLRPRLKASARKLG